MWLTEEDLKAISQIIKIALDKTIEEKLSTQITFGSLLTKDVFYRKTSELMKELKAIRKLLAILVSEPSSCKHPACV